MYHDNTSDTTMCYSGLFHGSSQRCGTLRSIAWAFPTSSGELFLDNDRCYAYNDRRRQGKLFFFASDSRLSYHSASSPVTYQPQRTQLLSDVNVFGGLFLSDKL